MAINVDTVAYLVRRVSVERWTNFLLKPNPLLAGLDRREKQAILDVIRCLWDKKDIEGFTRTSI